MPKVHAAPSSGCVFGYRVAERKTRADTRLLRRLWSEEHGEPWPDGMYACHSCDEPRCSSPHHIFPATAKENTLDAVAKGHFRGMNAGETHGASKLSFADVTEIKALAKSLSQRRIAKHFGINPSTVSRVVRGERWATFPRKG